MSRRDVIIDCDPGIDDALALMLAAGSPELRLLGVTCVAGSRPLEQTAHNACGVLDLAGCAGVPVHAGCPGPIVRPTWRDDDVGVPGDNGLGGVVLSSHRRPDPRHAVDYLVHVLQRHAPDAVTLIALGPVTNLALAETLQPGTLRRARDVLVMGGAAFRGGNVTPYAEFNFHVDPVAARVVLGAGARLTIFGLDVTEHCAMSPDWIASLGDLGSRCARAAHAMLAGAGSREPLLLHDACPVGFAIDPTLFGGEEYALSIDWHEGPMQGRLHAVRPSPALSGAGRVITRVDTDRLMSLVRERIGQLP